MIFPINLKVDSRPVSQQPDLVGCLPPKRFWSFNPCMGVLGSNIGFGEADQSANLKPNLEFFYKVNLGPVRKNNTSQSKGRVISNFAWTFCLRILNFTTTSFSFASHEYHYLLICSSRRSLLKSTSYLCGTSTQKS